MTEKERQMIPGYEVRLEDAASGFTEVSTGGVPWQVAHRAVLEELGQAAEDARDSGEPGEEKTLRERRDASEPDEDPTAKLLSPSEAAVIEALVADGEEIGFYELVEEKETPAAVQDWLNGGRMLKYVLELAEEEEMTHTVKAIRGLLGIAAPKVFSVEVALCATMYVRAATAEEAAEKARAFVEDGGFDLDGQPDVISGKQLDDPNLPEVSLSPAMTLYGDASAALFPDSGTISVDSMEECD